MVMEMRMVTMTVVAVAMMVVMVVVAAAAVTETTQPLGTPLTFVPSLYPIPSSVSHYSHTDTQIIHIYIGIRCRLLILLFTYLM